MMTAVTTGTHHRRHCCSCSPNPEPRPAPNSDPDSDPDLEPDSSHPLLTLNRTWPPQAEPLAFAQRPVHSDGWMLGTRPAWQQPAFEDMFVSCHTKGADKKRPPLINLMLCMELLSKAHEPLAQPEPYP